MVQSAIALPDTATTDPLRSPETSPVDEYRRQKHEAQSLLQSLMAAKAECEEHQARFNRPDMYRAVTGRSALDAAIASTTRMIERLDAVLARAQADLEVRVASVRPERSRRVRPA